MDANSIKQVAKQLQSPDVKTRRGAIIALGKSKNMEAVKFLNWSVRNEEDEDLRKLASTGIQYIRQHQDQPETTPAPLPIQAEAPKPKSHPQQQSNPADVLREKPQSTTDQKGNNQFVMQDGVMFIVVILLFVIQSNILSSKLIHLDKVLLQNGRNVGEYVQEVKKILSFYDYSNLELAMADIESIDGRLQFADIGSFYNSHRSGAELIIRYAPLYETYLYDIQNYPNETMGRLGIRTYEGERKLVQNLYMIANLSSIFMVVVAASPLLAMLPTRRAIVFKWLFSFVSGLGMQVLWLAIVVIGLVNFCIYLFIYTRGINPFLYDLLANLQLPATTINSRQIFGGEIYLVFIVWGVIATIALGAVLFRPMGKNAY